MSESPGWFNGPRNSIRKVLDRKSIEATVAASLDGLQGIFARSTTAAATAMEYAQELYERKFGEDPNEILANSPVIRSITNQRTVFDSDPDIYKILVNVRVRPILTAAAMGATGAGILAGNNDEDLSRITRHIFDGDQLIGGLGSDAMASLIGAEQVQSINAWMDTVPGSGVMGGGWLHRLQHGHDLEAVAEIYKQYGFEGASQALYHIYGRDFFTPAGIPILPVGSNEVHQFLTGQLGLSPLAAADLLSITFAELLGTALSGVFAVVTLVRLSNLVKSIRDNNRIKDLVYRAQDVIKQGDMVTASGLLQQAMIIRPHDGILKFIHASVKHRAGDTLQAHFAFNEVVQSMAADEPLIKIEGSQLSLRGIAAAGALSTSNCLMRSEQYQNSWRDHVIGVAKAGITAFERVAEQLIDRRFIKRFGSHSALPPCWLSAACNYYLAGRMAGCSMYLPEREDILTRVSAKIDQLLSEVATLQSSKSRTEEIAFLRRFTKAEFDALTGEPKQLA